ncbi:demethylmenaquinone methyltransferase [Agromyces seonyuensis]|uniref:Demethylmenaquinone methyltransferase n=1 Tax=Agromyces seonyuensis TaxID=2662446 RepID=A0A6I4P8I7_9MICO|nr:demethylmenaquinone methyltransferase [Agromyces seonyuensis]MWC00238.1 demethylmenaquinone methyltransferase [Agromyces seonyuensis]
MTRADLGKDPHAVSAMFDQVAARYDLTNNVLSVGNAPLWRIATTRAVAPKAGERILDVAAGTGTSSAALAASGAEIVAADFSPGMIAVGRERQARVPNLAFVEADATKLPFGDAEFDAVTISFGLRNVNDTDAALAEFLRVVKPGGRLVVCEFSTPPNTIIRSGYHLWQGVAMPALTKLVSSNDTAYDYLNESINAWPDQQHLARRIAAAGWTDVKWRNLTGGIVALHRAFKPAAPPAPAA